MNNVTLRMAENKDFSLVYELLQELGYSKINSDSFNKTWYNILSNDQMGIVVAEISGKVSGYLAYSFKPQLRLSGISMEIDELSVSSLSRSQGIGSKLLVRAKEIAKQNDVKQIIISTNRERESYKRGFYLKNGFQEKNSAWFKMDI